MAQEIKQVLLDYVVTRHGHTHRGTIDADTLLLKQGIIDSLSMMTFLLFIEETFHIDFMSLNISRDDFASVAVLSARIERFLSGE